MIPLQTAELQAAKGAVAAFAGANGYTWLLTAEGQLIAGLCTAIVNAVDQVRRTYRET